MIKKVFIVIYAILIGFCIFIFVYNTFFNAESDFIMEPSRAVFFVIALFIALAKIINPSKKQKSLKFYENFYKETIKDSFCDDKKNRKKLLKTLAFYNVDKFDKAIEILNSLQPLCKTSNEKYAVNFIFALNYEEIGKINKTISHYEELIEWGLADSSVYSNLSILYSNNGNVEKSIDICTKAILFNPENPSAYNNLACAYFRLGDYENTIENAQKAVDLDAKMLPSIKLLAVIYALLGNEEKSEIYKKRAICNGISKKEMEETIELYLGED